MFQREIQGRLHIYKSNLLRQQSGLVHGFSSRTGGYSRGFFSSLNLSLTTGDDVLDVRQNRLLFATTLGIGPERVVCGTQVHSTNIARVGAEDGGKGFLDAATGIADTDGLVTDERGVALMTLFADCVPVLFHDPVARVIAVTHCGWKGTVGGIAAKMAGLMAGEYGCDVRNIRAAIGPSISKDAYEVDTPVIEQFREAFSFAERLIDQVDDTHARIDLWEANRLQLIEAGLQENHIEVSGLCTFRNNSTFFSHRADGGKTGRNGALIMMM